MNLSMTLAIALGGALGSVARWIMSNKITHMVGSSFPWGTLAVNVVGCFLLGVVAEGMARSWNLSPEVRDFIRVGILGGFTTFSTFSLDAYTLIIEHKQVLLGLGYALGSVALGVLALVAGLMTVRMVLP
ncbi:MAG: hypothetical protein A2516_10440 [Alphaproteobacteria bacterium RIFOXYD12_FULL_60_8]|nr:MAG: hypothetical protein A2516_10440 [Alphaproteobacteria bacterium RIFOXYD12_FULL_60_8]